MTLSPPQALGLNYGSLVALVETIAQKTALRTLATFDPLIIGMGGQVTHVPAVQWSSPKSNFLEVRGPRDFTVYLSSDVSSLHRMLLACALGHYILHTREGRLPTAFARFAKDAATLEGLWFGMSVVIPDEPFALAEARGGLDDSLVAELFKVPVELIALKRKLVSSAQARACTNVAA